jgi:hypothetical protein
MAPPKTVAFSQELGLKVLYSNTVATAPRKPFLREAKEYLGGLQQLYIRYLVGELPTGQGEVTESSFVLLGGYTLDELRFLGCGNR